MNEPLKDPILILATPDFEGKPDLWAVLKNSGNSYFVMSSEIAPASFDLLENTGLGQVFLNSVKITFTIRNEKGNAKPEIISRIKKGYKHYGSLNHGAARLELLNTRGSLSLFPGKKWRSISRTVSRKADSFSDPSCQSW
ncbi:hypothetical protein, partial [Acidithiobacillus thiooxidans]|uniref:hypothetical protein n=1 Tax=Acidithiobacillus thiooxidans TaxID=930 RepID=UPI001111EBCE